jgi:hypothetical protein
LLAAGALEARAQVVHDATARKIIIVAGGTATIFQPDFAGDWSSKSPYYPIAKASNYPLVGMGAFVDVKVTRWVQLEAEGHWNRFNQFNGISQDNYLIGPRATVYRFWRSSVYAKGLVGFSNMNFDTTGKNTGRFTTVAFGGGMDIKLTKRLSFRAADLEYQYWPKWGNSSLSPYGASMGFGYRVF